MSEGCLLWHSRHCGRDTTGVLYKGPLTPSEKRAARLIRQALRINLGRICAALSVRSWEIYRPSSSVRSWPRSRPSAREEIRWYTTVPRKLPTSASRREQGLNPLGGANII